MIWSSAILGAFLASMAIFGCTALAVWPMMRRAFLGWVLLRIVALTVMVLALAEVPLGGFWPQGDERLLMGVIAADISLAVCGPLMASYAEPWITARREKKLLRLMLPLVAVPIALLPAVVFAGKLDWLHDSLLLILIGLLAVNLAGLIARGSRAARFQTVAWAPGLILATTAIGHELLMGGVISFYIEAVLIALLIDFVVSAAGVTDGFLVIRNERDEALADVHAAKIATATDPLTDIANRRGLDSHFNRSGKDRPSGIALIDCDHFKRINDQFGHDVGDRVLVAVAKGLGGDRVFAARLGGEEFVVLAYGADWQSLAEAARRRITQSVREQVPNLPFPVTASAGLAAVQPGETLAEAMKRADRALYAAKEAGRNRSLALTEFHPHAESLIAAA